MAKKNPAVMRAKLTTMQQAKLDREGAMRARLLDRPILSVQSLIESVVLRLSNVSGETDIQASNVYVARVDSDGVRFIGQTPDGRYWQYSGRPDYEDKQLVVRNPNIYEPGHQAESVLQREYHLGLRIAVSRDNF